MLRCSEGDGLEGRAISAIGIRLGQTGGARVYDLPRRCSSDAMRCDAICVYSLDNCIHLDFKLSTTPL